LIKNLSITTIIFDLSGVVFQSQLPPFHPIEKAIEVIKKLKNKNLKIIGCTNNDKATIEMMKQFFPQIMNSFDDVITPQEAGHQKPNLGMFLYAINKNKLVPTECIFIDDIAFNTDAANQLGINTITHQDWVETEKQINTMSNIKL
jgi:putative hydrolase of the HAD superfamily